MVRWRTVSSFSRTVALEGEKRRKKNKKRRGTQKRLAHGRAHLPEILKRNRTLSGQSSKRHCPNITLSAEANLGAIGSCDFQSFAPTITLGVPKSIIENTRRYADVLERSRCAIYMRYNGRYTTNCDGLQSVAWPLCGLLLPCIFAVWFPEGLPAVEALGFRCDT